MRSLILSVFLVAASLSSGCTSVLVQIDPRPNVLLPVSSRSLTVQLEPTIPDDDAVAMGVATLHVRPWRDALQRGFHAGFDRYFAPADPAHTGLALRVLSAEPTLRPVAYDQGFARTYAMSIRYQAELVDASGAVLMRFADTATSPAEPLLIGQLEDLSAHAIENMYERIAKALPTL